MTERESRALNQKLSMRAVYTDKNTQSSMISARQREEEQEQQNGGFRGGRSSIVVSPASKFASPFEGNHFDFTDSQNLRNKDDIQLKEAWDKNQDCKYIQNRRHGNTMKSGAFYMAHRLQGQSKTNTTRSSIGKKRSKKSNHRGGASILSTDQAYLQEINQRQSMSITSGNTPQHQRIGSIGLNSNNALGSDQFLDDQRSIGGLSSIEGHDDYSRRQLPVESPNNYNRAKRTSGVHGKPPMPKKLSKRKSSVEEVVIPAEIQFKEETKRNYDQRESQQKQDDDDDEEGGNEVFKRGSEKKQDNDKDEEFQNLMDSKQKEEEKEEKKKPDLPQGGKYDADGFYIMPSGEFYDPEGIHFSKDGEDKFGGYYDEEGYYHTPEQAEEQDKQDFAFGHQRHAVYIPKVEGAKFNKAGFYELPNGAFYDPLGNFFDKNGYDAAGGSYDQSGVYQKGKIDFEEGQQHEDFDDPNIEKYQKKYQEEKIHLADPQNIIQQKLDRDQIVQEIDDEAEEKPAIPEKQFQKIEVKQELAEQSDDDEDGVEIIKVSKV